MKARRLYLGCLLAAVAVAMLVLSACGQSSSAKATVTSYTYDPVSAQWVKNVEARTQAPEGDGATPVPSNTIEIFLDKDEPVKAIILAEALITRGGQPLLELAGRPDPTTGAKGDIRICTLVLKDVEAESLVVKDTEAVHVDVFDVAAKDNELDVEIEPVNVVRCGRGGTSVISAGIERGDADIEVVDVGVESTNNKALLDILGKDRNSGIKVDRVRILGPEGKTGFVENIIVLRTSVFGRIEVRDVKVQDIFLNGVSLDDNVSTP